MKIFPEDINCARLAQLSTTLFSSKLHITTNFYIVKNLFTFKNRHLREKRSGIHLSCSLSTTEHNFYFIKIQIFENYMFQQISKLSKMYLCCIFCNINAHFAFERKLIDNTLIGLA